LDEEDAMTSSAPVRIGIVGLGRLGRRHAENLAQRVPGAVLAAACSPVAEEVEWAREALGVKATCAEYEELLRRPDLDAVFLVTPTSLHAGQVIQALEAGKHVFCEKPLALDAADCRKVEQVAASKPGLVVMIGFVRRFDPSYQDAYAKIQAGAIGRPFLVRSQTGDKNDPSGFFVRFAPTSGGIFLDCSIHDIDLARWLRGAPRARRVFATGTVAVHEGLKPIGDVDNGVAVVEFEGGGLACLYASRTMAHGHATHTEIIGTAGSLTVGLNPRLNRVEILDGHGVRNECVADFWERFEEAFLREAVQFVDCVRRRAAPPLSLADATEATRIGMALAEAQRGGKIVDLG
jgi:myo-inositol 2-dehydrogenase / D-chiro-inositol 1-dehydrogenase